MKTFLANIKQTGLANAISIATVTDYYNAKSKYAVASCEWKAEMNKKSKTSEDDSDDGHCSLGFAKALGFETAEECDEYFERWEQDEKESQEKEEGQTENESMESKPSSAEIKRNIIARCFNSR